MALVSGCLVSVLTKNYDFTKTKRRIPIVVEDGLQMVAEFRDPRPETIRVHKADLTAFRKNVASLDHAEKKTAFSVSAKNLIANLSRRLSCVGCRKSVERLVDMLAQESYDAIDPLFISKSKIITIKDLVDSDPDQLFLLINENKSKANTVIGSIPRIKKSQRCQLHSIDNHRVRFPRSWLDMWELLSQNCRDELTIVPCDTFLQTLDSYLRKHRFCSECKSKVMRAYNVLIEGTDMVPGEETGYYPGLYEGIRYCARAKVKHLHFCSKTEYIVHLIDRAEPELSGTRRERHAKTFDIAQVEVLICLGIHLYERLFRLWQKFRAEELAWQLLYYGAIEVIKENFELAVEKKQGVSKLELFCQELDKEEQARENRLLKKRQKRKKKKVPTATLR